MPPRSPFVAALLLTLALLAFFTPAFSQAQLANQPQAISPSSASIQAEDAKLFHQHTMTLSNSFFEGRAPGTRGNVLAAEYLEFHFKRLGLIPAFPIEETSADGTKSTKPTASFRQPFQLGTRRSVAHESLSWTGPTGNAVTLKPGVDFNTLAWSANADVTGPLAFVGYGITAGKEEYTSYPEGTDLTGKIVIVLRFEPMTAEGTSKWAEERWSFAANVDPKFGSAIKRGAAAVIFVAPPEADDDRVGKLEDVNSLPAQSGVQKAPVLMLSTEQADALVRAADPAGRSLLDLRKLADEAGQVIDLPNAKVTITTQVDRAPIVTDNVGGVLLGKGPLADEYIVLGAHYDHVGYGLFGSRDPNGRGKLHPGADDNASGSSGMLVLAEKLSKQYAQLPDTAHRRSIAFLGFTGEESGLNGSRHYTKNMPFEKTKHYFMLNLDMIGRLNAQQELEVSGVGTAEGLEDWLKPYLDHAGMTIASKAGGTGPSDHASFFAAEVPVLFFFTGLHEQYHMPTDTADLINTEGAVKVIDLTGRITLDMAQRPGPFPYVSDPRAKNRDTADANKPSASPAAVGVRFGITPGDYNDSKKGVLIGEVAAGWSAAKGGLKAGDRMLKWNDKDLDDVESWMPLLSTAKPGDKVTILYEREGKQETAEVTLMARDSGAK